MSLHHLVKKLFIFLADKSQAIFYTSAVQKEQVQRRFYLFPQVSMSELRCYLSLLKCFLQPNWHFSSLRISCLIFWYFTEILFKIKWTWISQTLSLVKISKKYLIQRFWQFEMDWIVVRTCTIRLKISWGKNNLCGFIVPAHTQVSKLLKFLLKIIKVGENNILKQGFSSSAPLTFEAR